MTEKNERKEVDDFINHMIANFDRIVEYEEKNGNQQIAFLEERIQNYDEASRSIFASGESKKTAAVASLLTQHMIIDILGREMQVREACALMHSIAVVHERLKSLEDILGAKAASKDLGALQEIVRKQEEIFQRIRQLQEQTEESRKKSLTYLTR